MTRNFWFWNRKPDLNRRLERFGLWRTPAPAFEKLYDWEKNLTDNPHIARVSQLLQQFAPAYDAILFYGLLESVRSLKLWGEEVTELETSIRGGQETIANMKGRAREAGANAFRARLIYPFMLISKVPGSVMFRKLTVAAISLGLSLMVFIGMAEMWGVELTDPIEETWVRLLGLLFSALSVNLGTQYILKHQVNIMLSRRYAAEPNVEPSLQPFWQELCRGNGVMWAAFFMVLLEVLFTFYFLLQRLPVQIQDVFLAQCSVFFGAGYLAFLNVMLSWTEGLIDHFHADETSVKGQASGKGNDDGASRIHDFEGQYHEAQRSAAEAKARLRTYGKRFERSERQYRRYRRAVIKYSQRWFRGLPYLLEEMEKNGAPSSVLVEVAKVLGNGHGPASGVRIE
jgi:hypothetical protein